MIAVAHRRGAQAERVGARGRLGDAERLQPQFAARDPRQITRLLRRTAVPQHGAHRVHLRMAGCAVAARGLDLFHDGGGRRHGQAAAAVLLRDQGGEESGSASARRRTCPDKRARGRARANIRRENPCTARGQTRGSRQARRRRSWRLVYHTGSHENTSLERSSGVNEVVKAPLSCLSILSGVQPSERCKVRIGRV